MERLLIRLPIFLKKMFACEAGGDTVEFVLLVTLIAFGSVVGARGFAGRLDTAFTDIASNLSNALDPSFGAGTGGSGGGNQGGGNQGGGNQGGGNQGGGNQGGGHGHGG
jgi:Flp pilus assembly pilin Flp